MTALFVLGAVAAGVSAALVWREIAPLVRAAIAVDQVRREGAPVLLKISSLRAS